MNINDPVVATVTHPTQGQVNIQQEEWVHGKTYARWPNGGTMDMYNTANCSTQDAWQNAFNATCGITIATATYGGQNWTGNNPNGRNARKNHG